MLTYFARKRAALNGVLELLGDDVEDRIRFAAYGEAWGRVLAADGPVVFADIEHLNRSERVCAGRVWHALDQAGYGPPALNHPEEVRRRRDLLHELRRRSRNHFSAYPADDLPAGIRFPVFVRNEAEHRGSLTPLLRSRTELDRWLARLTLGQALGGHRSKLLVVEFLDTADTRGIYRKYAAFRIGDRIIPRCVLFSRHWMVKKPDLFDDDLLREERAYLAANPDEEWVLETFDIARITYGRIDYGIADGQRQVWEINTNPIVVPVDHRGPRESVHRSFATEWWAALTALESSSTGEGLPVTLTVPVPDPGPGGAHRGLIPSPLRGFARGRPRVQRAVARALEALPDPFVRWLSRRLTRPH